MVALVIAIPLHVRDFFKNLETVSDCFKSPGSKLTWEERPTYQKLESKDSLMHYVDKVAENIYPKDFSEISLKYLRWSETFLFNLKIQDFIAIKKLPNFIELLNKVKMAFACQISLFPTKEVKIRQTYKQAEKSIEALIEQIDLIKFENTSKNTLDFFEKNIFNFLDNFQNFSVIKQNYLNLELINRFGLSFCIFYSEKFERELAKAINQTPISDLSTSIKKVPKKEILKQALLAELKKKCLEEKFKLFEDLVKISIPLVDLSKIEFKKSE